MEILTDFTLRPGVAYAALARAVRREALESIEARARLGALHAILWMRTLCKQHNVSTDQQVESVHVHAHPPPPPLRPSTLYPVLTHALNLSAYSTGTAESQCLSRLQMLQVLIIELPCEVHRQQILSVCRKNLQQ